MQDGHLNVCIKCVCARISEHRQKNLERIREYDRTRANLPHRVETRRKYGYYYSRAHAEKRAAHGRVFRAIKLGRIKRNPCEICGSVKSEAHHADYSRPLNVRWLCSEHHKQVHAGRIELNK